MVLAEGSGGVVRYRRRPGMLGSIVDGGGSAFGLGDVCTVDMVVIVVVFGDGDVRRPVGGVNWE